MAIQCHLVWLATASVDGTSPLWAANEVCLCVWLIDIKPQTETTPTPAVAQAALRGLFTPTFSQQKLLQAPGGTAPPLPPAEVPPAQLWEWGWEQCLVQVQQGHRGPGMGAPPPPQLAETGNWVRSEE